MLMYKIGGPFRMGHRREPHCLRGMTWDHSRGYTPMVATAQRFSELNPGIPTDTLMNFYMVCSTLGEEVCQSEDHVVSAQVGAQALGMLQTARRRSGTVYQTTRCPIRIDGQRLYSEKGSPDLGEDTDRITMELIA